MAIIPKDLITNIKLNSDNELIIYCQDLISTMFPEIVLIDRVKKVTKYFSEAAITIGKFPDGERSIWLNIYSDIYYTSEIPEIYYNPKLNLLTVSGNNDYSSIIKSEETKFYLPLETYILRHITQFNKVDLKNRLDMFRRKQKLLGNI